MDAFWISLAVVFVAEMGDKSQLVALAFATRFHWSRVLIGISIATLGVHLISVALGALLAEFLTDHRTLILLVSAAAFLVFAAWTLFGDRLTEEDEQRIRDSKALAGGIVTVALAFGLAELGDKTMLATVTLATHEDWFPTWIGSTVGMVLADALAVALGAAAAGRLTDRTVRLIASSAFLVFGILLLLEGLGVWKGL